MRVTNGNSPSPGADAIRRYFSWRLLPIGDTDVAIYRRLLTIAHDRLPNFAAAPRRSIRRVSARHYTCDDARVPLRRRHY